MPRTSRKKSYDSTYHIMCHANGDDLLFRADTDKEKYLELLKRYKRIYKFKVYAYCLMDTHCHFIIYANGADISKIMHDVNQQYAQYHYNKVYERRGHVFCDRFKSKIIEDDVYLFTAWGYIHNNPFSITDYENNIQNYPYSSLGIYLGNRQNSFGIIDPAFVTEMFSDNLVLARIKMINLVKNCTDIKTKTEFEFKSEKQDYRSEKQALARDAIPEDVLKFVAKFLKCDVATFYIKNSNSFVPMRCISVLMLKTLCGLTDKKIATLMGNITQSSISRMLRLSSDYIKQQQYQNIFSEYLSSI